MVFVPCVPCLLKNFKVVFLTFFNDDRSRMMLLIAINITSYHSRMINPSTLRFCFPRFICNCIYLLVFMCICVCICDVCVSMYLCTNSLTLIYLCHFFPGGVAGLSDIMCHLVKVLFLLLDNVYLLSLLQCHAMVYHDITH